MMHCEFDVLNQAVEQSFTPLRLNISFPMDYCIAINNAERLFSNGRILISDVKRMTEKYIKTTIKLLSFCYAIRLYSRRL